MGKIIPTNGNCFSHQWEFLFNLIAYIVTSTVCLPAE